MILRLLTDCLNAVGREFLENLNRENTIDGFIAQSGDVEFCHNRDCAYSCIVFDFFIKQYFPRALGSSDIEFEFLV